MQSNTLSLQHSPASLQLELADSIHHVDKNAWDTVTSHPSPFLSRDYLACIEAGSNDSFQPRYATFRNDRQPVGVAVFNLTDFVRRRDHVDFRDIDSLPLTKRLVLAAQPSRLPLVVCGSSFHAGENGFAFAPSVPVDLAAEALVDCTERIRRQGRGPRSPVGALFKEFAPGANPIADRLSKFAYHALEVDPVMVLNLDPNWTSFDHYLRSLTSKYRVKARRAYAKSEALVSRALTPRDFEEQGPRLQELHGAVLDRADFRLAGLDVVTLERLRCAFDRELIMQGYFLADRLVGFMTAFVVDGVLEAHLVGIDYELNHDHAIYQRMLYDYIHHALDCGVRQVNYGRTATEIKSSLGAVPVQLRCFVRHRNPTMNRLLPLAVRAIRPGQTPLKRPFKKAWYEMHGDALAMQPSMMTLAMG